MLKLCLLYCAPCKGTGLSTRLLHKSEGVLLIKDKIRFNQLSLIQHDFINNSPLFSRAVIDNPTSSSSDDVLLSLTRPNCEQFRRSIKFCNQGISEWNNLRSDVKKQLFPSELKNKLRRQILHSYELSE